MPKLQAFRAKAIEMGLPSLATGALIGWEWLQREVDFFATLKRERIGGLMLCRDGGDRGPWPTWPKPDQLDFTHLSRKVKEVIRAADLHDELSFTSFRHGGLTETGDAELTDREILAQSRHTTVKVLPEYVKRTHHKKLRL
jgi:hypothetical protein